MRYESKPWLDTFSTPQAGNFSQLAAINFTHWGFNGLDHTAAHREQPAVAKLLDFAFSKKTNQKKYLGPGEERSFAGSFTL